MMTRTLEKQLVNRARGESMPEIDLFEHKVTAAIETRISQDVPVHKVVLDWISLNKAEKKPK